MSHEAAPKPAPVNPARFIPSPKLRAYLYTVAVAAGALLVFRGVVTAGELGLWLGLAGAVLGLSNGLALANTPKGTPNGNDG